ncbi:hypothetical protein [Streptomyces sp. NPDC049970]|uniref:hypothetical protein n=1 Tax=Streptomyces sp. NPDC049970 TaxID=3155033 RepID=UPI003429B864
MSDEYNSDLAYGSPSSDSSGDSHVGQVGEIAFVASQDIRRMREVATYIARVDERVPSFREAREAAGPISVRFGRAEGGGIGHWDPAHRTVVINPHHRDTRGERSSRLMGTAVFEILNAGSEGLRTAWEDHARAGDIELWAAQEGITPGQYYGRAMEQLEFGNVQHHRQIMADLGRTNSRANMFSGLPRDFGSYYRLQQRSSDGRPSHVHSYEVYYNVLRPGPIVQPGAAQQYTPQQTPSAQNDSNGFGNTGTQGRADEAASETTNRRRTHSSRQHRNQGRRH